MLGRHDLVDTEVVAGRECPAGAVRTDHVGGGPTCTPQDATTRPVLAVELLAVRSPWIGHSGSRHESNFHLSWTHLHDGTLIVEAHASGDRVARQDHRGAAVSQIAVEPVIGRSAP